MEKTTNDGVIEDTLIALERLKPVSITHGNIRELRGGIICIDLEAGDAIESAIVLAKGNRHGLDSKLIYRIDYAIRGNIRGVLPDRKISYTSVIWGGWLKKTLKDISWVVPGEISDRPKYSFSLDGNHPKAGEVWEEGPHHALTNYLNDDAHLLSKAQSFLKEVNKPELFFTVFSDRWNESIRVTGGLWIYIDKLFDIYASPTYLDIVNEILNYLKEIRKRFGGIIF